MFLITVIMTMQVAISFCDQNVIKTGKLLRID